MSSRVSGILLHPTSLPGRYGIGDLGPEAYSFVDFLCETGQSIWQILPLGPTGYGDSPYQCFSAFANNPLLVSPDVLVDEGHLSPADVEDVPSMPDEQVDYGQVIAYKIRLLKTAFENWRRQNSSGNPADFTTFCEDERQWLDDYALFMALKNQHKGGAWSTWEPDIARRQPKVLVHWRHALANEIEFHKYVQYLFRTQWLALKQYAGERGIRIVGDIQTFSTWTARATPPS
jgi:4-alpha-glucanotransferase